MIVVVDTSVLVAELLRQRGRALFAHPDLLAVVAEEQWEETEHEIAKRIAITIEQGRIDVEQAKALHGAIHALFDARVIEVIPRSVYEHHEALARRRVPRDPNDWAPVALALTLDAGILTVTTTSSVAAARHGRSTPFAPSSANSCRFSS